jgi:hypothetical protein
MRNSVRMGIMFNLIDVETGIKVGPLAFLLLDKP